jgi:hypothetical protein
MVWVVDWNILRLLEAISGLFENWIVKVRVGCAKMECEHEKVDFRRSMLLPVAACQFCRRLGLLPM